MDHSRPAGSRICLRCHGTCEQRPRSWQRHSKKFGPYNVVTDDHGSCGNAWALDTELRTFTVKRNRDGTFRLWRRDRGTFLTNEGQSPGACETHGRHGATVPAGKTDRKS